MRQPDHQKLLTQLKRDEGTKRDADGNHIAYRCAAGALTIGYGHNLDANPVPGVGDTLTENQAERLLEADVYAVQTSLEASIPWAHTLSPVRYAVLVNMAFNLGVGGLMGFKSMLAYARVGDFRNAAREMLRSKWAGQVGARAERLARQMETDQWQ